MIISGTYKIRETKPKRSNMLILKSIRYNILKMKFFLSYESYEGTRRVKDITNDPLMNRPILLYEKISRKLGINPYFLGIILIVNWPSVLWLNYIYNPDLFWRTFTFNGLVINFVIWIPFLSMFFYLLLYLKKKYFETLEDLRPIITKSLYEELKSNFVRKRVLYIAIACIWIPILVTLSYEIILGFRVGFWTENMPAWSGFRFGIASLIVGLIGGITMYTLGADAVNVCFSWLLLPFLLSKDIGKSAYRDPAIFRKVKGFKKFTKNLVNMSLMLVLMICLELLWLFLQPVPVVPFCYVWSIGVVFLAFPLVSASQLRDHAIKKTIDILEYQYMESEKAGLECEAAKNADGLYETYRADNDIIKSQEYLKKAAEKYGECGEHFEAAKRYTKLADHKKSAESYKKVSDKEDDAEYKKFYKANAYAESAEDFIQMCNRDKAHECLNLAEIYFKDIASITSNHGLKNSALYRSREALGRLIVFDALKIYEDDIQGKRLNNAINKLTDAQRIFKKTSKVCPGIGEDAEIQLEVHALMCEFYKRWASFEHSSNEYEIEDTVEVGSNLKLVKAKKKRATKHKINKLDKLDECINIIKKIAKKFLEVHRLTSAKKAEASWHALLGYKFYKQGKNKEAVEFVNIAEDILKHEFGRPVKSDLLYLKIDELIKSLFYMDFQFSAPMCFAVDPNAYSNCIEFENETEIPKEISQNEDIYFKFKIYYKQCPPYLDDLIKVKLKVSYFGKEYLREGILDMGGEPIYEQFLINGKDLMEGENYIKAEISHDQGDCDRPIDSRNFIINVSQPFHNYSHST